MLLEITKPIFDFSFIIPTRNNLEELNRTISSIVSEVPENSEIVIVDGSDSPKGEDFFLNILNGYNIRLKYVNDNKNGIYNAMNLGVQNSSGKWLVMLTAGDYLKSGAKSLFKYILNSKKDVVVFAQDVEDLNGKISFSFFPTMKTIWPHQSVVLKRLVHEELGLYPNHSDNKYTNEQVLFAEIRKNSKIEIRNEIFSVFCLGGLSSKTSFKKSKEYYKRKRELGCGIIYSLMGAYVFTNIRYVLENTPILRKLSIFLRIKMFSYYKKPTL